MRVSLQQLLNLCPLKSNAAQLSTVTAHNTVVPWLAAEGPYAYTPEDPPADDKLFDYGRVMPDAFCEVGQYPFGCGIFGQSHLPDLETFWREARDGQVDRVYYAEGRRVKDTFQTPLAVYEYEIFDRAKYMMIQNGSYQIVDVKKHPEIRDGRLRLERGIGHDTGYLERGLRALIAADNKEDIDNLVELYFDFRALNFVTSLNVFLTQNSIHIDAAETDHLSGIFLLDEFRSWMKSQGHPELYGLLLGRLALHTDHYSLSNSARRKFGPNYIAVETPLSNIAISSFFAEEGEVRLVNPDLATTVAAHGCSVSDQTD